MPSGTSILEKKRNSITWFWSHENWFPWWICGQDKASHRGGRRISYCRLRLTPSWPQLFRNVQKDLKKLRTLSLLSRCHWTSGARATYVPHFKVVQPTYNLMTFAQPTHNLRHVIFSGLHGQRSHQVCALTAHCWKALDLSSANNDSEVVVLKVNRIWAFYVVWVYCDLTFVGSLSRESNQQAPALLHPFNSLTYLFTFVHELRTRICHPHQK